MLVYRADILNFQPCFHYLPIYKDSLKDESKTQIVELQKKIIEAENKIKGDIRIFVFFNYSYELDVITTSNNILKSSTPIIDFDHYKQHSLCDQIPDCDLLIRTGNHRRLSNFLLPILRYTELYFISTLWPDITNDEILNIIDDFKKNTVKNLGL